MLKKLFSPLKNDPFNQANEHFHRLRYFESGSPQFENAIFEIIRLCQLAIQKDTHNGDAHVLLANAYLLAALNCAFSKGYPFFLARAAAVIQATRRERMYIKNKGIADKIYRGIYEQLSEQTPDWVEGVNRLTNDMNTLHVGFYANAINPSNFDQVKSMLTSESISNRDE